MSPRAGRGRLTGRRAERRRGAGNPGSVAPGHVTRTIPHYAFLDEEALVRMEDQAEWILQEVGIEFRDDASALQIWRDAGADVQGTRVRTPRGMARALCGTAPGSFEQLARNPARTVTIGGNHQVFAPVYGAPFVR